MTILDFKVGNNYVYVVELQKKKISIAAILYCSAMQATGPVVRVQGASSTMDLQLQLQACNDKRAKPGPRRQELEAASMGDAGACQEAPLKERKFTFPSPLRPLPFVGGGSSSCPHNIQVSNSGGISDPTNALV